MKVRVCDVCKEQDNTLTETTRGIRVTGRKFLNIDCCDECRKNVPKGIVPYTKFIFELKSMEVCSDEKARKYLKT